MKYVYEYSRPALTVDVTVVQNEFNAKSILLIRRKNDPFRDSWALPGGFVEINETVPEAASRELTEETGFPKVPTSCLIEVGVFSRVDRDPRERVISVAYAFSFTTTFSKVSLTAGDDAADAQWFPVDNLPFLAFDHEEIVERALESLETL